MWIPKDSGVLVCNVSHQVAIKSSCGGDGRPALKAQEDNYRRQAENQGGTVSPRTDRAGHQGHTGYQAALPFPTRGPVIDDRDTR